MSKQSALLMHNGPGRRCERHMAGAGQPLITPGAGMPERTDHPTTLATSWYTAAAQAAHEERCTRCRALTEAAAALTAANAASIARRDRLTLGLRLAVTA